MDFLYAQETVCWIHVGDAPSSTHLKCAKIPNLKSFTEERVINISLSLHRKYNVDLRPIWLYAYIKNKVNMTVSLKLAKTFSTPPGDWLQCE